MGPGVGRDRVSGRSEGKQRHLVAAGWLDSDAAGRGWLDDAMVVVLTDSRAASARGKGIALAQEQRGNRQAWERVFATDLLLSYETHRRSVCP
jgi:hypothetical protein